MPADGNNNNNNNNAVPPKLKKLRSLNAEVGAKISLKCEASAGNPQPSYKWFKDGKELKKSKDIRIKYGNGKKNSRLQFNKVKTEDAGEYTCEAENVLGTDAVKGTVTVRSVSTTLSSGPGHTRQCNETVKSYCVNGGVCYYIEGINQLSCRCPNGFFGQRCLEKLPLRLYMPDPKQSMFEDKKIAPYYLKKISWVSERIHRGPVSELRNGQLFQASWIRIKGTKNFIPQFDQLWHIVKEAH
ncbi:hypothetical protein JRQ81_011175 [Phrynocephalus forsythii]|uniref:Uncharacterized protein n=1 Tax=Phrynocephalus forsythii TaxID=171643 RepID=A0A9Q1B4R3_9SAUR|nr:hypothetical protein JRQ81_011175 [Phrynocephalus forsythii]